MNNIFDKVYFGKPYRTSEDDIALYLGEDIGDFKYRLAYPIISDITNKKSYIILQCDENGCSKCDIDIVSEWQEEIKIRETELDKLAEEYIQGFDYAIELSPNQLSLKKDRALAKSAFKAGCRKIMTYLSNKKK